MSDPYTIPGTDTLRNKLGITDPEELLREEYRLTEERLVEFEQFPTTEAFDLEDLRHVHRRMFCDIYEWAGELRTTWIGKREHESGGRLTRFTEPEKLVSRGSEIFSGLRPPDEFLRESSEAFVEHITKKYNEVNLLHPFREGNGRALRAFFGAYAEEAGYQLRYEHISKERWMKASIEAGFGSDGILSRVFRDGIDPMAKERFTAIEPLFETMRREGLFNWNDHYISFPAPGHTIHGLIAVPGRDVCALINDGRVEIIDMHAIRRALEPGEEVTYTEPDRHPSQRIMPHTPSIDGGYSRKIAPPDISRETTSAMDPKFLRVTSQGSCPAWGANGNRASYMQAIKASTLRYAWNIEQSETGVLLRGVDCEIHDAGKEIIVRSEEAIAARGAVDLAILKGWKSIDVSGGTAEMFRAVAIEAHERGLGLRADGRDLTEAMIESYHEAFDREIKQTPKL